MFYKYLKKKRRHLGIFDLQINLLKDFHPMEESANSSVYSDGVCFSEGPTSSEETSWTSYAEYFRASEERRRAAISSSDVEGSSSMISNAASCASVSMSCRKVRLREKRGLRPLDGDDLEDTASSPVNSPKVSAFTTMYNKELSKEPGVGYEQEKVDSVLKGKFVHELDLVGGCPELKKRGLCLVPMDLAMLLNQYGG